MDDKGKGVHLFLVDQDIQLHQLGTLVARQLIVKRSIASGTGFQRVKEVVDDLIEGQAVTQHCPGLLNVLHTFIDAPPLLAQIHDRTDIFRSHHDLCLHHRLLHVVDLRRIGKIGGVGQVDHISVGLIDFVDYTGGSGHQIQVVLPLQPLLDDLQVQKPQESAAESKSQRYRRLRFKLKRSVVELQLLQRVS